MTPMWLPPILLWPIQMMLRLAGLLCIIQTMIRRGGAGVMRIIKAENKVILPPIQDQDKGRAHIHYIRQLAQEIWIKDNASASGKGMSWEDAIRAALNLHVKKLINKRVKTITTPKPPTIPARVPAAQQEYSNWGW